MKKDNDFIVPLNHVKFKAKPLLSKKAGNSADLSVAFLEPGGGGPSPSHTHEHDHYFYVIYGTATIKLGEKTIELKEDEAYQVPGSIEHSVWNLTDKEVKMIGFNI